MTVRSSILGLTTLALVACVPARAQQPAPVPTPAAAPVAAGAIVPQIVANGQGEAKIVPDRARLEVSVQTRAATAAQAGSENARKQQAVLDALKKMGFGPDQLSTVNYNLYPEMQYDRNGQQPRVTGYSATNTVRIEIRDIGMVGKAIDASLEAGANMISSLSFYPSNTDAARRSALESAVARARDDADAVARAAGGSVGALLEITTTDFRPPVIYNRVQMADAGMAKMAQATPVEPGEQTVTAMVNVRWAFVPNR
ncbi:MAG TPA: SIMPL domain-containing protein [Gemmatimonadaceae bacterium]|nr:SIMPL domain-containing protein [Gemmatimonadaceae bacterium]